jgi:2-polyprenyl-3-methyl-5-hydroxy-6-metoxy-1,4-benzoquinol methylase
MNKKETFQNELPQNKHVEIISKTIDISMADEWYELAGESHFWLDWRLNAMLKQIKHLNIPIDKELKVFEVGCGTGILRATLESVTKWKIDAADLNMNALLRTKSCRGRTILYDIFDEHSSFIEAYDIVILYDVLEHIHNTKPFLASVFRHLKQKGLLLVNVPALQTFYSEYDDLMGHYRRYNKNSLTKEFDDLNLQIEDIRYWGFCMLPLLVIRKFVMMLPKRSKSETIRIGFTFPKYLSYFCEFGIRLLMRLEMIALSHPPVGTSLLMVGQKI